MPAVGRFERHAGVHQRERGAAHRRHRRRAVRLGDLGDDAERVGELVLRRQHRMDRAPGELAVADLAAAGRADAAGLADREGREVVVQQERLLVGALQRVDPLLVLAGAERRHHQRLRLAAGEQRRAVRARQDADLDTIGRTVLHVAAVDALAGVEDVPAYDLAFELLEHAGDAAASDISRSRRPAGRSAPVTRSLDGVDRLVARRLCRDRIGRAQVLLDQRAAFPSRAPHCRAAVRSRGSLAAFSASLMMASITGWKCRWPNITAPSMISSVSSFASGLDHQHGVLRAGDDEVELALRHLVDRAD
mgnify:CR=1 FL=1